MLAKDLQFSGKDKVCSYMKCPKRGALFKKKKQNTLLQHARLLWEYQQEHHNLPDKVYHISRNFKES